MRERIRARGAKIKASEVAEACGGELPAGWDDLLPPDAIDKDIENA